jgi:Ser/Thr protein kinase RdoA (MazF antagonist)
MLSDPLERSAQVVLVGYDISLKSCESLGNAGGFSGARIWRIESEQFTGCLKAWPPAVDLARLSEIHRAMSVARSAGLEFVPRVFVRRDGTTCIKAAGQSWDLVQWMAGSASAEENPPANHITSALTALARLHAVWRRRELRESTCPAIARRLDRLADWEDAVRAGWRPEFSATDSDSIAPVALKAWNLLPAHLVNVRPLLSPLRLVQFPVHTCLGDIWRSHVLFQGDRVVGIIDFGAVRTDSPAVDLARLLGSLSPFEDEQYAIGLQAYRKLIPVSSEELRLVHALDYTGTVIGTANWLLWAYRDHRQFEDRAATSERLAMLVARLERFLRVPHSLVGIS